MKAVRGDAAKIATLAIQMGDDEGMVVRPRSLYIPAWGRRFVIDGDNGDILKVQFETVDNGVSTGRRFVVEAEVDEELA
jgi:hypothetical protein